jgi:putative chitinase
MAIRFNRDAYFDAIRDSSTFNGSLDQGQVDGMDAILAVFERDHNDWDWRWLAYALATTVHETAATCLPIEEYGKGSGMEYGKKDPETGQTYYGRGFVQLTWRDNYAKADKEIGLGNCAADETSCEWHAENALDPSIAAQVMFEGMHEGWFRSGHNFARYFGDTSDPYGAREIINGDKSKVPSWSNGVSIGNLIKGYYDDFLAALHASAEETEEIPVVPDDPTEGGVYDIYMIRVSKGATVELLKWVPPRDRP